MHRNDSSRRRVGRSHEPARASDHDGILRLGQGDLLLLIQLSFAAGHLELGVDYRMQARQMQLLLDGGAC